MIIEIFSEKRRDKWHYIIDRLNNLPRRVSRKPNYLRKRIFSHMDNCINAHQRGLTLRDFENMRSMIGLI